MALGLDEVVQAVTQAAAGVSLVGDGAGLTGPAGEEDGVIGLVQFLGADVPAHGGAALEGDAFGLQQGNAALDQGFVQLHGGDAVGQQTAGGVVLLQYGDGVAPVVEIVGCGQPGGAGADHGNGQARPTLGRPWGHPALLEGVVDDGPFVVPDGHGLTGEAAGAGTLAGGGADPAGELREAVGF